MARRGAPSLYEILRKTPIGKGGAVSQPGGTGSAGSSGAAGGAGSGPYHHAPPQPIVFQVPLTWAVVLGAVVALLVVAAYMVGARTPVGAGGAGLAAVGGSGEVTPWNAGNQGNSGAPGNSGTLGGGEVAPLGGPTGSSHGTGAGTFEAHPSIATDNKTDPRVKTYKYFVLAHPSTQRAPGMVEFCRANGLDAYLVPDDNAMLRKIVVLPGYRDSSEKSSEPIRKLEAEIRRVGEKWKNAARGNKDFSDAYPEMYR